MAKLQKNSFIVVPDNDSQLNWLQEVLIDEGEVIKTDVSSIDRVRQLLDLTGSQVVFVALSKIW